MESERQGPDEARDRISLLSSKLLLLQIGRLLDWKTRDTRIQRFSNFARRREREREGEGVIEPWSSSGTMVKEGAFLLSILLEKTIASNVSGRGECEKRSKGQVTRAKFLSFFYSSALWSKFHSDSSWRKKFFSSIEQKFGYKSLFQIFLFLPFSFSMRHRNLSRFVFPNSFSLFLSSLNGFVWTERRNIRGKVLRL